MSDTHAMLDPADEADPVAEWLRTIESALAGTTAVNQLDDDTLLQQAQDELYRAVTAARDAGLTWGTIGAALGVARGNAYQRYRRHPAPAYRRTR